MGALPRRVSLDGVIRAALPSYSFPQVLLCGAAEGCPIAKADIGIRNEKVYSCTDSKFAQCKGKHASADATGSQKQQAELQEKDGSSDALFFQ